MSANGITPDEIRRLEDIADELCQMYPKMDFRVVQATNGETWYIYPMFSAAS